MRAVVVAALCVGALLHAHDAVGQVADLGHKLPGGIGLDAGTQPDQGLYVANRVVWFASDQVNDRNGVAVPIENLDIDAFADVIGIAGTLELHGIYVGAGFAVPIVGLSLSSDQPVASVDRLGLGDIFVEPLRLGTRFSHLDTVASYSFYAPTGQGATSAVGQPQWSQQVSWGGTVFFDDRRGWRVSALASYLHNSEKLGIDITRGDSVQIQGGAGGRFFGVLDVGIAGYALWQVTDDRGSALPPQLRGARERVFGVGPEVDWAIPALRTRLTARFEWDLGGEARPVGTIFVFGATVAAVK